MSTEEMSLEDLFCAVDDFCRVFLPDWHRQQLQCGERKRRRGSRMVLSEIMTILIHFHQSRSPRLQSLLLAPCLSALGRRLPAAAQL